ncbi:MAG: hypothetical protein RL091_2557 [Verrucomicrobiota bacterium]
MKTQPRYAFAVIALLAFTTLHAANPVMVVQAIQTEKTDEYLALLAKANLQIESVTGLKQLRHAWTGDFAGQDAHGLVVVSMFDSTAAAVAAQDKLMKDAGSAALMKEFAKIRKRGPQYLMKAQRWEGLYDGGAVFNTNVNVTDEAAYLKALDGLKAIFDANGFKDAKLNLLRVAAGREDATHIVVICFPNQMRVAELIDLISDTAVMKDWNAAAAKIRTVVHNGTYHEITK